MWRAPFCALMCCPRRRWPVWSTARFFKVVRAGFGQKRKQLANSLSTGLALPKEQTAAWLRSVDIDPARRAETLTLEEWGNLVRAMA